MTDVVTRFGISGPYIVLCPGAEYGPAKRWPYFRELAARLDMQIVLLGSAGDLEDNRADPRHESRSARPRSMTRSTSSRGPRRW